MSFFKILSDNSEDFPIETEEPVGECVHESMDEDYVELILDSGEILVFPMHWLISSARELDLVCCCGICSRH